MIKAKRAMSGRTLLQEFREEMNMSRKQLAEIVGCSPRTIEAWEQGKADLASASVRTVVQIAEALEVDIGQLIDIKYEYK